MDLGAYANIDLLDDLAKLNNIEVPRLRGYRLMKDEEPADLKEITSNIDVECVRELCRSKPFWKPNSCCREYSSWTELLCDYYCTNNIVRWGRIHGWKRRVLKTYIHNEIQRHKKQCEVWNKYAGRDDVLYIHARIGGGNWPAYFKEVVHQPWFLEKVDDAFDSTYCDIYAKLEKGLEDA